ncbi:hypothetical protein [Noviherbaspirillum cavernae]|nr:hypothetical protein [Noviherbaspirillum cavernae]
MKRSKELAIAILLLGLLASTTAWARPNDGSGVVAFKGHAHRGHFQQHGRVAIIVGTPVAGGWSYYYRPDYRPAMPLPYYAYPYPQAVVIQSSPPLFIEQGYVDQASVEQDGNAAPQTQAPPVSFWFYCNNPKGYYPNVKSCSQAWLTVPAQSLQRR